MSKLNEIVRKVSPTPQTNAHQWVKQLWLQIAVNAVSFYPSSCLFRPPAVIIKGRMRI